MKYNLDLILKGNFFKTYNEYAFHQILYYSELKKEFSRGIMFFEIPISIFKIV